MGGHLGVKEAQERVWQQFYRPGVCTLVRRFVASCDRCQRMSPERKVREVSSSKSEESLNDAVEVIVQAVRTLSSDLSNEPVVRLSHLEALGPCTDVSIRELGAMCYKEKLRRQNW